MIRIHLVARLLRLPLLRVDGDVVVYDDAVPGAVPGSGRTLADAERLLGETERRLRAVPRS